MQGNGVASCNPNEESFVFISYAHEDADAVFPVLELVSERGYAIWYDKGINISSTWTDEIALAIMNCKVFLFFVSDSAVGSPYVRSEVEYALNRNKKIVPVYLDGMNILPPGLAMGLNATQGITDVGTPGVIAQQVCAALEFNDVPRRAETQVPAVAGNTVAAAHAGKRRSPHRLAFLGTALGLLLGLVAGVGLPRRALFPPEGSRVPARDAAHETAVRTSDGDAGSPHAVPAVTAEPAPEGGVPRDGRAGLDGNDGQGKGGDSGGNATVDSISLSKKVFRPTEPILFTLPGVTPDMLAKGTVVGIVPAGAGDGRFLSHEFAAHEFIRKENATVRFVAPVEKGGYEVRWYADGSDLSRKTLKGVAGFNVEGDMRDAFALSTDKTVFAPGEGFYVKFDGVPWSMVGAAVVGLFRHGETGDAAKGVRPSYITYITVFDRAGTMSFDAPQQPGRYEMRGYSNDKVWTDATLVGLMPVDVEAPGAAMASPTPAASSK